MVKGGSGLCRTTQVKFMVLSLFMYISGSPTIMVTGSVKEIMKVHASFKSLCAFVGREPDLMSRALIINIDS